MLRNDKDQAADKTIKTNLNLEFKQSYNNKIKEEEAKASELGIFMPKRDFMKSYIPDNKSSGPRPGKMVIEDIN